MASAVETHTDRVCEALRDPAVYERGEARAMFARLRAEAPVWWTPEPSGKGFWSVLRYADIQDVSRSPDRFSSARHWGGHRIHDEGDAEITKSLEASMLSMDPPEHAGHRALVTPAFTSGNVNALEVSIRERVRALLDRLGANETCDFVSTVAAELPIQVVAELMGVPQEDRLRLFEWSNALVGEDDPDMRASPEHVRRCMEEMGRYSLKLWRERLRRPKADIVSMLVHGAPGGEGMSVQAYFATFFLLVIAGNESVRNSISGGLLLLAEHPEQRRRLLGDPSLFSTAVKEIVRCVSPFLHMRRTATCDTRIGGQAIQKGDKVVVWYLSGNFDEAVFDDPERFDVGRRGPPQIGFGFGQHFCLGFRLAELQLRVLFEELLLRFPEIEPSGPARRVRSNFVNGIKSLPVRPGRESRERRVRA